MYKYILESVNQINWMAIIPLLVFFTFFCLVIIKAMREKKEFISRMEKLPLEND